jgi:23S rRNA (uracil1939-C5)-methyltransferase
MKEPFRYRNKAQFPIGTDRDGRTITGFYAGRTHSIIECRDCLLGAKVNTEILNRVLAFMESHRIVAYDEATGRGLIRHVMTRVGFATGEIMVCIVINGTRLPDHEALVQELIQIPGMTSITLSINKEKTNVILGRSITLLWGRAYIEDTIGTVRFRISPLSFYQVNPEQTEKLYGKALEYAGLTGRETVWDLYCGIGTISLFLAQKARAVYGVEIVPEAIRDAEINAQINHIDNATFYTGRAEDVLPEKYKSEGIQADVIVVDPPRKGCEQSVLDTMVAMAPHRIVYVSCDSATLARDLRYLCDRGYELNRVCPVDMFGNSVHVETVCLLNRDESLNMKTQKFS